jgi:hypothetical protein
MSQVARLHVVHDSHVHGSQSRAAPTSGIVCGAEAGLVIIVKHLIGTYTLLNHECLRSPAKTTSLSDLPQKNRYPTDVGPRRLGPVARPAAGPRPRARHRRRIYCGNRGPREEFCSITSPAIPYSISRHGGPGVGLAQLNFCPRRVAGVSAYCMAIVSAYS